MFGLNEGIFQGIKRHTDKLKKNIQIKTKIRRRRWLHTINLNASILYCHLYMYVYILNMILNIIYLCIYFSKIIHLKELKILIYLYYTIQKQMKNKNIGATVDIILL